MTIQSMAKFDEASQPSYLGSIASELTLVCAIIYVPQLQWAFGTTAFPLNLAFLFACMPSLLPADELRKAWLRRRMITK